MAYYNVRIIGDKLEVVFTEPGLNYLNLIDGTVEDALEDAMPCHTSNLHMLTGGDGGYWIEEDWDAIDKQDVECNLRDYLADKELECQ